VDRLVLNLSGNDATAKTYGLKRFTAKGTVTNSLFDVRGGSVGMVTVGRFIDSNLYVGYTPGAFFEDPGTFVADFKLEKFSTTAKWLNDANNLWDYAFSNSQLVADNIGTVKLTGLNTSSFLGTFGIKFKTAGGSVKVTASDSVDIPLNTNLTPTTNVVPLANQFFYLDVL
jgi:hypothetical protein